MTRHDLITFARYLCVMGVVMIALGGYIRLDGIVSDGLTMLVVGYGLGLATAREEP